MSLNIPEGYGLAAWVFTSTSGTQPFVTTCGVSLNAFEEDYVAAANHCFNAYKDSLLAITDNDLTLSHVTLSVGADGPSGSVDSDVAPAPGGSSGTFAPVAMAPVIRKVTNTLGRSGRGRMFIPGVIQEAGADTDGRLTTLFRTQLQTAVSNLYLELDDSSAGAQPYLLHSDGITMPPSFINSFLVTSQVGWIRGRIR